MLAGSHTVCKFYVFNLVLNFVQVAMSCIGDLLTLATVAMVCCHGSPFF